MTDTIWFLNRCALFEGLSPSEVRRLEQHSSLRTFTRHEPIYFPDEPGRTVLLLARGRVKIVSITPDGREAILAFVDEGDIFGELAILDGAPRREFAEAVDPSLVLAIPREDVTWLMERRPDVALQITKLFGLRLRRVENRLRNVLFRTTRERIIAVLLELIESHGQKVGDVWQIGIRLSHQDLANLIGATRESVTVTLGGLQREGIIAIQRRRIQVLQRTKLSQEAEAMPGKSRRREHSGHNGFVRGRTRG